MSADFLAPDVIKKVFVELKDLTQNPPEGIKVVINEEDVTDVQALIDGPEDTPFAGGVFKMKLKLGSEYPQAPPKGYFLTKIFHPNVSDKGEICVNTLKKDWKADMGIRHLLLTIKCLLMQPNPESALNEEAGKLLLDAYEDYFKHAQLMTQIHALKKAPVATPATSTTTDADAKKARVEKENVPRNKAAAPTAATAANNKLKKSLKRL